MELVQKKSSIAFLSTFPPRQCGIAVFTNDLRSAIDKMFSPFINSKIVAMNVKEIHNLDYSNKVIFQINQSNKEDYIKTAKDLNSLKSIKLISIQHEFGIFGEEYGSNLILFLKEIKKPVIVTFHSVLPNPDEKMKMVIYEIDRYSKGIVVMTKLSKEILIKDYKIDSEKIKVIPHGIHSVPYTDGKKAKSIFGFSGKLVLSTFGFLSSGKGLEYIIDSLPPIIEKFPNVKFIISGITHPNILEQEGEKYRNFLMQKVNELKLENNVHFYNEYFDIDKLLKLLEATDIYISPSLNPNQAVSGTMSYALGSGRAVISTSFSQAKEDITNEVGRLVDFKNSQAFTNAIFELIGGEKMFLQIGKNAYFRTRHMTWENVAYSYMKFFSKFVPDLINIQKKFPPIKFEHIIKLTDDFGIIQFAELTEPDLSSGYTLDDNARALIATSFYYKKTQNKFLLKLIAIYLNFIEGLIKSDGYFYNYVNEKRIIDEERNIIEDSQDPSARALYALSVVLNTEQIPLFLKEKAKNIINKSIEKNISFSSPRSIAFYVKALNCLFLEYKDQKFFDILKQNCDKLVYLYESSHSFSWEWFEGYLTYSNAVLSEALIVGYSIIKDKKYLDIAEKTFNFLINQTFKNDKYIPIGQNGWFIKDKKRHYFDQQPEDTASTVQAFNKMFMLTNKDIYRKFANTAFNWFLGDNILGQVVYDRTTGGCYDGIGKKFINLNQGAESTISYILARLSFDFKTSE
ncbi:MAG: glycosyltransferase [Patescibacteria group bacterium]|nr:glycosyltransferase [Patescibacteria group bacterium]MDD4304703.1 glycosyltransferase [Patescibacteria group bacterium]MDD4695735.1 glycosyltransferase [Patescibacteria group bacterium]